MRRPPALLIGLLRRLEDLVAYQEPVQGKRVDVHQLERLHERPEAQPVIILG